MEKVTKNIITRESITDELSFYNKSAIRYIPVLLVVFSLVFVPITAICVSGFRSYVKNEFLKIISCVFIGSIMISPVLMCLYALSISFIERKLIKNGDFDITVRKVQYKSEKIVHKRIKELLHFEGFKAIAVDHTEYQLASMGDEYYIVYYPTNKTVKLLYSTKRYEYKER